MTSDETIRKAARVIGSVMSRWDMDGRPDVDGGIDTLIARALADAGLLAPPKRPTGLWRAITREGDIVAESSSRDKVLNLSSGRDLMQQLWVTPAQEEWRTDWYVQTGTVEWETP